MIEYEEDNQVIIYFILKLILDIFEPIKLVQLK
jgi:hypothetical protein